MKQMMTHCLFILLFLCFNARQLHAQHFLWGRSGGGGATPTGDNEIIADMATDRNGNVYILSQVVTQGLEITGQPLTGWGANDIMLASFAADGSLRWVKLIGNGDVEYCYWLGTDDKDGVYFAAGGNKSNNAIHIDKDATSPKNYQWFMLVKYDTAGIFQWYRHPEADTLSSGFVVNYNRSVAMDVDDAGNIYWLMLLYPGAYGGGVLNVSTYQPYILKYNRAGNFSYIKPDLDLNLSASSGMNMTVDADNGRFYLSGYKSKFGGGSITMGGSPITGTMYIGCFELDGTYLWHKQNLSGDGLFHSRAVVDAAGDIYVAGEAHAAGLSGNQPTVFNGYTVTSGGGHATPFISKMDKSGNLIWAKTARVNGKSGAKAVALRNKDELVIAGSFPGMLEWPGYSSVVFNSPANYYYDMFVTRMSTHDGTVLGLDRIPSNFGYYEFPNSMASDGKGNVYIGGEFTSVMYVNREDTLLNTGGGQTDWFLVKYGDMWPVSAGGAASMPAVKVYPNPTMEQLMVAGVEPGTGIQLLNMPGQLVRQTTSEGSTAVINTEGLPPGSYLLQLTGKDGSRQIFRVEKL